MTQSYCAIYQHLGYSYVQPTGGGVAYKWPSDKVYLVLSIYYEYTVSGGVA
jgi:hypothetical protein